MCYGVKRNQKNNAETETGAFWITYLCPTSKFLISMLCRQYNLNINDFGPSWRDGIAFNAIVHSINPNLVDMQELQKRSNKENLTRAFSLAEKNLGIPQILDPEGKLLHDAYKGSTLPATIDIYPKCKSCIVALETELGCTQVLAYILTPVYKSIVMYAPAVSVTLTFSWHIMGCLHDPSKAIPL